MRGKMGHGAISVLCLLFLVAFLQGACAAGPSKSQMKQALRMVRNICQPKTGASTAAIDGIMKGKFPDDDKLKEYCNCILGLMKLMKNNKFDADGGLANIEKLPESLKGPLKEGVTKCRKADAGTTEARESAYAVVKCMYNAIPDQFIFP